MTRIFIVEDDNNIREIETIAMKNSGYQVEGFANGADFLRRLEESTPDLVLLDIMLPDESGSDILMKLRRKGRTARIPVIMVTAKTAEEDMIQGFELGADDYIRKPFSVMELITRVKALLRRSQPEKPKELVNGEISMDVEKRLVYVENTAVELTYKEFELLRLLMNSRGVVVTRETIMRRVWDTDFEGESRTLDMHIKTLRKKLGDAGKQIRTIRNVGFVIE